MRSACRTNVPVAELLLADFEAMGLASLMVVAVAMAGSVTVLPALLGERVEKGKIPFLHPESRLRRDRRRGNRESRFCTAVLRAVLARPAVSVAVAAGALLAIATPALGMKTQDLTLDQEFGDSLPIVQTYNRVVQSGFPTMTPLRCSWNAGVAALSFHPG